MSGKEVVSIAFGRIACGILHSCIGNVAQEHNVSMEDGTLTSDEQSIQSRTRRVFFSEEKNEAGDTVFKPRAIFFDVENKNKKNWQNSLWDKFQDNDEFFMNSFPTGIYNKEDNFKVVPAESHQNVRVWCQYEDDVERWAGGKEGEGNPDNIIRRMIENCRSLQAVQYIVDLRDGKSVALLRQIARYTNNLNMIQLKCTRICYSLFPDLNKLSGNELVIYNAVWGLSYLADTAVHQNVVLSYDKTMGLFHSRIDLPDDDPRKMDEYQADLASVKLLGQLTAAATGSVRLGGDLSYDYNKQKVNLIPRLGMKWFTMSQTQLDEADVHKVGLEVFNKENILCEYPSRTFPPKSTVESMGLRERYDARTIAAAVLFRTSEVENLGFQASKFCRDIEKIVKNQTDEAGERLSALDRKYDPFWTGILDPVLPTAIKTNPVKFGNDEPKISATMILNSTAIMLPLEIIKALYTRYTKTQARFSMLKDLMDIHLEVPVEVEDPARREEIKMEGLKTEMAVKLCALEGILGAYEEILRSQQGRGGDDVEEEEEDAEDSEYRPSEDEEQFDDDGSFEEDE